MLDEGRERATGQVRASGALSDRLKLLNAEEMLHI
jgi:hypothetical protein